MNAAFSIGNGSEMKRVVGFHPEEEALNDCICIIPAYGHGEHTRSNLMPLAGRPLLSYTIDAALDSGEFDEVLVSSDDEGCLSLAEANGVLTDVLLSDPGAGTRRLIETVAQFAERTRIHTSYRHVAVMMPGCPLRSVEDIRGGMARYRAQKHECSLITVTPYAFPPELAMKYSDTDHGLTRRAPGIRRHLVRNHQLNTTYQPNGALYVTSATALLRNRTFFADPMIGYVMPPGRSFDINDPHQMGMAKYMIEHPVPEAYS